MPNRLKILIAEDSEVDIFLLKRGFEKTGAHFNAQFVMDGQAAVDYLLGADEFANRERYPLPSLIVLDLKMPRLNGLDVLKWLKAQPDLHAMPVVMFSSSDDDRDVMRAYSLGASSYLMKPTDLDRLSELVISVDRYWREFCKLPNTRN